jgi:hypothetical protein
VHFEVPVLVIDKYRYSENIFPRDVKFCPHTGNQPTAYPHLSLAGLVRGEVGVGDPGQRNPYEIYSVRGQNFSLR